MNYTHHIFCCTNRRPEGNHKGCCASKNAEALRNYFKQKVKDLGIEGVRINAAGCLDQCESGPAVVIYPEGVWYKLYSTEAIDRVITEHLQGGKVVEELRLNA